MSVFIGEIVRDARLYRGLTQKELARELGITQQSISSIESGRNTPNVYTLFQIGKALKLHLNIYYTPT